MTAAPRPPQLFDTDDPQLIEEPVVRERGAHRDGAMLREEAEAGEVVRPTLADLSAHRWRWGALFLSSIAGAAALGAAAWLMRLLSAALARDDWLGRSTLALLLVAVLAGLMLVVREAIGFSRLSRLNRLRREVDAALASADAKRERRAALRLVRLYRARADVAWGVRRFGEHARDVRDPGELLTLAEREILAPLDEAARRVVLNSAKRVASVTALSPMLLIAVGYVLIECLRMLRALATLYGGRPGAMGAMRLAQLVMTHLIATGGVAMTDDLLGQFLGQDLLRRLSRRLGEGAFNGALTARVGVAAVEVLRPLPYLAAKPLRLRDILSEVLKPLFARKTATAAEPR
jgi:putative membrane protein